MSYEIYEDIKQIEAWSDQVCILQEKIESFYLNIDSLLGKYKSELHEYCMKILDLENLSSHKYTEEDLTFFIEASLDFIDIQYVSKNAKISVMGVFVANFLAWLPNRELDIDKYFIKPGGLSELYDFLYLDQKSCTID